MLSAQPILVLHPDDDVGLARRLLPAGTVVEHRGERIILRDGVARGHKVALRTLNADAPIRKYGQVIGFATTAIEPGEHVHSHNLAMRDFGRDYAFGTAIQQPDFVAAAERRRFPGFLRPDGRVGTRNYVAVISSVNCSASVASFVRDRFRTPEFRRDFPHVDGVIAFNHKSGCCVQPGEPMEVLRRVHAGMARHVNIAGFVVIGLGCEGNQIESLRNDYRLDELPHGTPPTAWLSIQQGGGVSKTVERAVEAVARILPQANAARRTPQSIEHLLLAMNCGGSDGYSGITANPALGVAADTLVRHGATAVLGETPEIYGAEHLLMQRAVSTAVGEKLVRLIRWWEDHARRFDATIDNNPTPGNKAGGLTTIYEKSLGAVAKGGQTPLVDVYRYAEPITAKGFVFMDTPGLDPVSMTGIVAGGANVGVFTTGRGSVYGCKPSPCIKVATNSALYEHMQDDMDLNAGTIADGLETVDEVGARLFEKIVAVAGGERTKSELLGMGDEEFAPWQLGPTF
jgi:altronate hydrolase